MVLARFEKGTGTVYLRDGDRDIVVSRESPQYRQVARFVAQQARSLGLIGHQLFEKFETNKALFGGGFTGVITDSLGRKMTFRDGKRIKGAGTEQDPHEAVHTEVEGTQVHVLSYDEENQLVKVIGADGVERIVRPGVLDFAAPGSDLSHRQMEEYMNKLMPVLDKMIDQAIEDGVQVPAGSGGWDGLSDAEKEHAENSWIEDNIGKIQQEAYETWKSDYAFDHAKQEVMDDAKFHESKFLEWAHDNEFSNESAKDALKPTRKYLLEGDIRWTVEQKQEGGEFLPVAPEALRHGLVMIVNDLPDEVLKLGGIDKVIDDMKDGLDTPAWRKLNPLEGFDTSTPDGKAALERVMAFCLNDIKSAIKIERHGWDSGREEIKPNFSVLRFNGTVNDGDYDGLTIEQSREKDEDNFDESEYESDWEKWYGKEVDAEIDDRYENIEPPESLHEQVYEEASEQWGQLDEEEKMRYAGEDTGDVDLDLPDYWAVYSDGEDYKATGRIARYIQTERGQQLIDQRLNEHFPNRRPNNEVSAAELSGEIWSDWKSSSTSEYGLALQLATAEELGGHIRLSDDQKKRTTSVFYNIGKNAGVSPDEAVHAGAEIMKAYARATWEASQYVLRHSEIDEVESWRGIMMDKYLIESEGGAQKVVYEKKGLFSPKQLKEMPHLLKGNPRNSEKEEFTKLPNLRVVRNGCASFTTKPSVANTWGGVGGHSTNDTRVVLRAYTPRTAVLSLPCFGQNLHNEQEIILAGTKWNRWDAWLGTAPPKGFHHIEAQTTESAERKRRGLVVDLNEIDTKAGKNWLADVAKIHDRGRFKKAFYRILKQKKLRESRELMESGFTGEVVAKNGRRMYFRDGKPAKRNPDEPTQERQASVTVDGKEVSVIAHDPENGLVKVRTADGDRVVHADELSVNDADGGGESVEAAQKDYKEHGVHAKAFKDWFGDWEHDPENASKIVDKDGKPQKTEGYSVVRDEEGPKMVFHGTTHEFNAFDPEKTGKDNFLGQGLYFSDAREDVERNYAGVGPDLQVRISNRADKLEQELELYKFEYGYFDREQGLKRLHDLDWVTPEMIKLATDWYDEENKTDGDQQEFIDDFVSLIKDAAAKQMVGGEGHTLKCFLNIRKPVVFSKDYGKSTWIDLFSDPEESPDVDTDAPDYEPPEGPIIQAIRDVSESYDNVDSDEIITKLYDKYSDSMTAQQFLDVVKGLPDYPQDNETGDYVAGQFVRDVFMKLGHDGIVMKDANKFFPYMGIPDGANHYIAWEPTQIKSADNRGTFDAQSANIYESAWQKKFNEYLDETDLDSWDALNAIQGKTPEDQVVWMHAQLLERMNPVQPGFTGEMRDSLGRLYHFVNGKRVKGQGKPHEETFRARLNGEKVHVVSHDPDHGLASVEHKDGSVEIVKVDQLDLHRGKKQQPQEAPQPEPAQTPREVYNPDPSAINPETGLADKARVGVPANSIPPPPPIPGLPNLNKKQQRVQDRFAEAYEADPDGMADKYLKALKDRKVGEYPNVFATDDVKMLNRDWNPAGAGNLGKKMPEEVKQAMAANNAAVHQTANAIAKRAFVKYLDQLPADKKSVLVTNGGCAAGKGSSLKRTNDPNDPHAGMLPAADQVGAVYDAAGEQNATENEWILNECKKRGIKATFAYVMADPKDTWSGQDRGVIRRALRKGRMVDARLFADSYAIGARNMHDFVNKYKNDPDANFIFLDNRDKKQPKVLDHFPEETLNWNAEDIYRDAVKVLNERKNELDPAIMEGGLSGTTIWGPPKKA